MAGRERTAAKGDGKRDGKAAKAAEVKAEPRPIPPAPSETRIILETPTDAEEPDRIAQAFRALGDPVRVRIFNFLRAAKGPVAVHKKSGEVRTVERVGSDDGKEGETRPEKLWDGVTVGEVVAHLEATEKSASTVSHHLKELRQAGLIVMKRRGKHMICTVYAPAVRSLAAFLIEPSGMGETTE